MVDLVGLGLNTPIWESRWEEKGVKKRFQITVAALIAFFGIGTVLFAVRFFKSEKGTWGGAVMAAVDFFMVWIERLIAQFAAIGSDILPEPPKAEDFLEWLVETGINALVP